MTTMLLSLALAIPTLDPQAGTKAPARSANAQTGAAKSPAPGAECYLMATGLPAVPAATTANGLDELLDRLAKKDAAGLRQLQQKDVAYLLRPLVRVRVIESRSVASPTSKDKMRLASRILILEGPYETKEFWTPTTALIPASELSSDIAAKLAALSYEERLDLATAQAAPAPRGETTDSKAASERQALAAKRRAKKIAANRARVAREATETKVQAQAEKEAKAEYEKMLPYMLENQRQMLDRQSQAEANALAAERNRILNRALNGGGLQGVIDPRAQQYGTP